MKLPKTKVCTRCGKRKRLEAFFKNRAKTDGLGCACKACHTADTTKRAKANPVAARARQRRSYYKHLEKRRAASRAAYWRNRDARIAYSRAYGTANPDISNAQRRRYRAINGVRMNAARRRWYEQNRDYALFRAAQYNILRGGL